jgi:hypothetical protein
MTMLDLSDREFTFALMTDFKEAVGQLRRRGGRARTSVVKASEG